MWVSAFFTAVTVGEEREHLEPSLTLGTLEDVDGIHSAEQPSPVQRRGDGGPILLLRACPLLQLQLDPVARVKGLVHDAGPCPSASSASPTTRT
jgi:hypothetical protein